MPTRVTLLERYLQQLKFAETYLKKRGYNEKSEEIKKSVRIIEESDSSYPARTLAGLTLLCELMDYCQEKPELLELIPYLFHDSFKNTVIN